MEELITKEIQSNVCKYLITGDADTFGEQWPGRNIIERSKLAHKTLRAALAEEVRNRTKEKKSVAMPQIQDLGLYGYNKVKPMAEGLFPKDEQEMVLKTLTSSIIFINSETIFQIIADTSWHKTAWDLANLYLLSIDAELLGEEAPNIVGLSEETTCFISPSYFREQDRFADFLVHEAAHIFHNCKRETAGLPEIRRTEWLLPINFHLRETFAYSCEAYSRILELGRTAKDRVSVLQEHRSTFPTSVDSINYDIYWQGLEAAVTKRNGWKEILRVCKSPK